VHFRKTQAHNTIRIDGRDQARHLSKMAWVRTFAARPEGWSPDGALGWVRGTHDGYARDAGVEHHRTVWLRPDGYLVILDELIGTAAHHAEAVFQFAPGEAVLDGGSAAYVDRVDRARCELAWVASAAVQARIDKGGNGPTGGWIATSLGVREPAPRLVLQFDFGAGRAALLTVVADSARRGSAATILRTSAADGADHLLAEVPCGDGVVDRVIAAVSGCVRMPGLDTDAPLVVVRDRPGAAAEARQAGGTRVSLDPESFASRTTDQDLVGSRGSARPGRR
jgi:hypothetical protein